MTITTKEGDEKLAKTQLRRYSILASNLLRRSGGSGDDDDDDDEDADLCFEGRERGKKKKAQTDVFELCCCSCMGLPSKKVI